MEVYRFEIVVVVVEGDMGIGLEYGRWVTDVRVFELVAVAMAVALALAVALEGDTFDEEEVEGMINGVRVAWEDMSGCEKYVF